MSERFPGGIISKTAPVPTGPYENGTAPGVWTLEQQAEFVKQGIWPIAGNVPNYIEDVFQTWLYTGNGTTQTINNGIDLAGKGGFVWLKSRSSSGSHALFDTVRGATKKLYSNLTNAEFTDATSLTAFNSNGFSVGIDQSTDATTYASWTFREQPKFFDVVTWTGNGAASRQIAHNLGSTPGCVIVKATNNTLDWYVSHRSLATANAYLNLNTTAASATGQNWGNSGGTRPTSTDFTVGDNTNVSGYTYVAYLFAHNAGGFGLSGTDNVISCGSFTSDGSGLGTVNLGYEPQWVMVKYTDRAAPWVMSDTMRGLTVDGNQVLFANTSDAESSSTIIRINSTGFTVPWVANANAIYIAIRRGPMRTPTTGTSVFAPTIGVASTPTFVGNFPVDFCIAGARGSTDKWWEVDRLRGPQTLNSASTAAESSAPYVSFDNMIGCMTDSFSAYMGYVFRRAPGFFDEVCYTASSSQLTLNHNLGVVPEMIITKARSNADDWYVWCQHNSSIATGACISLNSNASTASAGGGSLSSFTASSFNTFLPGINGWTVVSYLFASAPGVSKVGSFTGTGATQTINCGFTGGARFVLIKATSTTGNWLVWDSARGIVAGNDPYLALNSTAAEVTNTDWVDTAATGFELSNAGGNLANSNGVSYIFLAIA